MLPRGKSGIWLLRVQTTNNVDPGRYSQRSTAFPRSDRKVNVGSKNRYVGEPMSVSVSASSRILAGFLAGFASGVTMYRPKSRPYSNRRADRGGWYMVVISVCTSPRSEE